jgi:hypothetical protein
MLWVDEVILGQRGRAHFYFFRPYRCKKSTRIRQVCAQVLSALAQPPFSLQTLLLFTDIRAEDAQRIGERYFKATYVGDIPGYYPGEYPVRVGYISLKGLTNGQSLCPPNG